MILLPIGRDESEIRRHAWVSYTIIAFNILAFIATSMAMNHADDSAANDQYRAIGTYLQEHPWLKPPQSLEPFLGPKDHEQLATLKQLAAASNTLPYNPQEIRRQQEHLNEMAEDLQAMVRDLSPQFRWGYIPAKATFLTLITSMFMHGGFFHLLGNLFFFFASGPFVEDVFGRPAFTALYLTGGMVAAWAHAWQNPGSLVPLVGASGAIAAIMGAYLVRFFRAKVEFLFIPFLLRPTLSFRFFLPAFIVLPLWFVWQFWDATHTAGETGVAVWAHVGGFAYGAAVAGIFALTGFEKKFVDPQVESQTTWKQNEHLVRAQEARGRWDFETAKRELRLLLQTDANNIDGLRAWYDLAVIMEDKVECGNAATRLLETLIRMNERELVIDLLHEVHGLALPMPEKYYSRAAAYLDRIGEREWALQYCTQIVNEHPQSAGAMKALMQSAKLYRQVNRTDLARLALQKAKTHPSATAEWQQTISTQLAELDGTARLPVRS